jgi:phi LC3 family holin
MINWKLRFKNKTTLIAMIGVVITFVYQMLSLFGVTPKISQDTVVQLVSLIINVLVTLGIVVDPTTHGISDSEQALNYQVPKK